MKRRILFWTLVLSTILGFGWYKATENEEDLRRLAAWQSRHVQLVAEAQVENRHIEDFLGDIASQSDAKQRFEKEFNHGEPLRPRREDGYEVATWRHPRYGTQVELTFAGNNIIASGIQSGSVYVEEFNPQPPRLSLTGRLEAIRQTVIHYGGWLWMVALAVALPTRRLGLFGAEVLLAISLAFGTANLVSPYFSLTLSGVLSNDSLFLSAGMVAFSVICLAFRLTQRGYQPRLQFGLRNILGTTAAVGGLFALGAFGLVALCVFAVGGVIFFVSCWSIASCMPTHRRGSSRAGDSPAMVPRHQLNRLRRTHPRRPMR